MVKKQSMGRQKIEIKKIEHEEARQVTFSKRRTGLFKKASELHTLCDAETAIIVFSPAGKAFSFGHPTVEEVTERFLAQNPNREVSASRTLVDAHRDNHLRELNRQCEELQNQLEFEKKTADKHKEEKMACHNQAWWEEPIENLGLHELEVLQASLEDLQKKVGSRMNELYVNNSVPGFAPEMNSVNALALCDSHFEAKPNPNSFVLPYGYPRGFACARQY